ncbi:hypothetical protein SAMN05421503_1411 [Terribacillus aidingensis]|uniref:Uncharacterized protein n=1 Tax=Terribacillus aidingensis TaxID=586416 RepID=A0A285NKE0_9BACI|nr:hypothetical protein [Terribacillus aidingensis]SNZ09905.1 hypothetical protein SAMN05421503_1411 [Terribacillus aidingensis]
MTMEIPERLAQLEIIVKNHDKRISKQEENTEILNKLSQLSEMQIELNKDMKVQMEKSNEIMYSTRTDVVEIKKDMTYLKDEVGQLDERTTDLEDDSEDDLKSWKKTIVTIATSVISGIVLALFGVWIGK